MKIWIWEYLDHVSDNWHEEGGLVVIAQDEATCRTLIENSEARVTEEEWPQSLVYEIEAPEPKVIAFPDAGCC